MANAFDLIIPSGGDVADATISTFWIELPPEVIAVKSISAGGVVPSAPAYVNFLIATKKVGTTLLTGITVFEGYYSAITGDVSPATYESNFSMDILDMKEPAVRIRVYQASGAVQAWTFTVIAQVRRSK